MRLLVDMDGVLSDLARRGFNPMITIGNRKSIDIVIMNDDRHVTIDVKSTQNLNGGFHLKQIINNPDHFYAFVAWRSISNISLTQNNPAIYIVPSTHIDRTFPKLATFDKNSEKLTYYSESMESNVLEHRRLFHLRDQYRNNYGMIREHLDSMDTEDSQAKWEIRKKLTKRRN